MLAHWDKTFWQRAFWSADTYLNAKIGEISCCPGAIFVVHYGGEHAKLPHLGVKIHEDDLPFWCQRAEVNTETSSRPFGRGVRTTVLPHAIRSRAASRSALRSMKKIICSGSVVAHHLLTLRVAQQPQQTDAFAADGIHRTKMRRFLVGGPLPSGTRVLQE